MSNHEMKACAVCARVLDFHTEYGYMHTMKDRFPEDHPAVPVSLHEVQVRGRCDFCAVDFPTMELPCGDFEMPGLPGHMNHGAFAACTACGDLIAHNRWDGLARRAAQHNPLPYHQAKMLVDKLYKVMRKNITGPLQALSTGDQP